MPFLALCGVENLFRNTCFDFMIAPGKVNCCPKYINIIVADGAELNEKTLPELINQVDIKAEDTKKPTKVVRVQIGKDEDLDGYRGDSQKGISEFAKKCLAMLAPSDGEIEDKALRKKEAFEKFKFACDNTKINYEELKRRYSNGYLTESEQKTILKQIEILQKYSSKTCELWQRFAYFEITNLPNLVLLKKHKKITDEEFDLFKPLVGKTYRGVFTFNELDNFEKQFFFKSAKKVKKLASSKFVSWFSRRHELPEAQLQSLESALMQQSADSSQRSLPPSYSEISSDDPSAAAGAFARDDRIEMQKAIATVSKASLIEPSSEADKYQNSFNYVKNLSDEKLSTKDLEVGYKKLELICKMLKPAIKVEEIKSKETKVLDKKILKELEKQIKVIKNISSSIFYVFFKIKEIEKLLDDKKMPYLKEMFGDDAYQFYLASTKGKRATFNSALFNSKELIELDLDALIIFFNIALKFSEADREKHKKEYPNNYWFEGIEILKK